MSESELTEQPVREKKTTSKPKPLQQLIYIGPNLPGGRLSKFTVFKGGVPKYLDDLLQQNPQISDLIVPVALTSDALVKTALAGTTEYESYQTLSALRG